MRIDVVTLFPELFDAPLRTSLLGKAVDEGKIDVFVRDLREHGLGKHRSVDDEPYGGGAGMVMRPEPIFAAVEAIRSEGSHVVLLSPRGATFDHAMAARLAGVEHLILVCGRYEGVDQRVADHLVDEEVSIGDYVLSGGEMAAMIVLDSCVRLLPGVMGKEASGTEESFESNRLEYPHYTRPREWEGRPIPDVLLSGNHAMIERWRREESERITRERRPDLLGR